MSAYAVDAVVVQREDGTRQATAFHVRFEPTARAQLRRASTSISQRATRALRWARGGEDDGGFSEDEEEENDVRVELDGEGTITCECVSDGDDGWCRFAVGDRPSPEELARQTEEAEGVGIAAALVRALANRRGAMNQASIAVDDDDSWSE